MSDERFEKIATADDGARDFLPMCGSGLIFLKHGQRSEAEANGNDGHHATHHLLKSYRAERIDYKLSGKRSTMPLTPALGG